MTFNFISWCGATAFYSDETSYYVWSRGWM